MGRKLYDLRLLAINRHRHLKEVHMFSAQADRLFSYLPAAEQTPGYSVLVKQNGKTLYERQFGFGSLEYHLPITENTVFHVASVSKQFTALCATLLEAEGRVDPDASILRYFPELPACMQKVTIRHLMHHTGGMREQWDLFTLSGSTFEDLATPEQTMRALERQTRLNFEPGERYQYCNCGYILLAQLVQRVTGQTLRRFAEERVFAPLGMRSTFFRDDHGEICHDRAESYEWEDGAYKHRALTFDVAGNTSLNTTPRDLCLWLSELANPQIFSPTVIERMKEPFTLSSGKVSDYCRGIRHMNYRGLELYLHTGANAGFRSVTLTAPSIDLQAVVLSNYGASLPYQRALMLLELLLPDVFEKAPESAFRLSEDHPVTEGLLLCDTEIASLSRTPEGLCMIVGNESWDFVHAGGNEYVSDAMCACLYTQPDGAIVLDGRGGTAHTFRPAVFTSVPDEDRALSGMYLSTELLTFYRLFFDGDLLTLEHFKRGAQHFKRRQDGTYIAVDGEEMALTLCSGTNPSFIIDKDRSQGIMFYKTDITQ